jgi:hypothetical protein
MYTTNLISQSINAERKRIREDIPYRKDYDEGIATQKARENEIISKYRACSPNVDPAMLDTFIHQLNLDKLEETVVDKFYSAGAMEAMACIASSIIVETGDKATTYTERIRTFLSDLKVFGEESVSGYAIRGGIKLDEYEKSSDLFVLKAPRSSNDYDELIHETVVGFLGTNQMRRRGIPNFAYVYGTFVCPPAFVDDNKNVISICASSGRPVSYSIYENIAPAETFRAYSKRASPKEILDMYLQTIFAVYSAKDIQFTHYDLHDSNVLIRKVSENESYIDYDLRDGRRYFIKTPGLIATIIDYGMSHISLPGTNEHYGHVGASAPLTDFGVRRDKYNPLYDPYKLLCFLLYGLGELRKETLSDGTIRNTFIGSDKFNELAPLLQYFNNQESAESIIANQLSSYYVLPGDIITETSPVDFIGSVLRFYKMKGWKSCLVLQEPTNIKLIGCLNGCVGVIDELENIYDENRVRSFFEFYNSYGRLYDIYSKTKTEENKGKIWELLENFIVNSNKSLENEIISNNILIAELSSMDPYSLFPTPQNYFDLLNDDVLRNMKNYFVKVVKFFDSFQQLELSYKCIRSIIKIFDLVDETNPFMKEYLRCSEWLDKFTIKRNILRNRIIQDGWFIAPETITSEYKAFIQEAQKSRKYKWYIITFPTLVTLINKPTIF